jgi:isoleucyl-tRNA synthetase
MTSWDESAPHSVHLCDYPQCDDSLLDEELNFRALQAQIVVKLGHKLRDEANQRVRQPLAELRFACQTAQQSEAIESLANTIEEELNIKQVTRCENLDDLVSYTYKPNLKTLGPKYGKLLGMLRKELPEVGDAVLGPLRRGESVSLELSGNQIDLEPDDVLVGTEQAADWVCSDDQGIQIAISTKLTPELEAEGMARDFVRQVQQLRKEADLEIEDRIKVYFNSNDATEVEQAVASWTEYILGETLGDQLEQVPADSTVELKEVTIGNSKVGIRIEKS